MWKCEKWGNVRNVRNGEWGMGELELMKEDVVVLAVSIIKYTLFY